MGPGEGESRTSTVSTTAALRLVVEHLKRGNDEGMGDLATRDQVGNGRERSSYNLELFVGIGIRTGRFEEISREKRVAAVVLQRGVRVNPTEFGPGIRLVPGFFV